MLLRRTMVGNEAWNGVAVAIAHSVQKEHVERL
jgi:hypothetical protein